MACIDADGTLTPTGKALLQALAEQPMSPQDVASNLGQPIFRVRGSLRELSGAEFIEEDGGMFKITEVGRGML